MLGHVALTKYMYPDVDAQESGSCIPHGIQQHVIKAWWKVARAWEKAEQPRRSQWGGSFDVSWQFFLFFSILTDDSLILELLTVDSYLVEISPRVKYLINSLEVFINYSVLMVALAFQIKTSKYFQM